MWCRCLARKQSGCTRINTQVMYKGGPAACGVIAMPQLVCQLNKLGENQLSMVAIQNGTYSYLTPPLRQFGTTVPRRPVGGLFGLLSPQKKFNEQHVLTKQCSKWSYSGTTDSEAHQSAVKSPRQHPDVTWAPSSSLEECSPCSLKAAISFQNGAVREIIEE